uniref:Uncharacterized protein n=1 Tax=Oryza rufipogon TaxID=4529 RepID=A0A0E0RCX8_ORYRU
MSFSDAEEPLDQNIMVSLNDIEKPILDEVSKENHILEEDGKESHILDVDGKESHILDVDVLEHESLRSSYKEQKRAVRKSILRSLSGGLVIRCRLKLQCHTTMATNGGNTGRSTSTTPNTQGYAVYKYRIRRYMDSEIRAIMAQYMPLDNQGDTTRVTAPAPTTVHDADGTPSVDTLLLQLRELGVREDHGIRLAALPPPPLPLPRHRRSASD